MVVVGAVVVVGASVVVVVVVEQPAHGVDVWLVVVFDPVPEVADCCGLVEVVALPSVEPGDRSTVTPPTATDAVDAPATAPTPAADALVSMPSCEAPDSTA